MRSPILTCVAILLVATPSDADHNGANCCDSEAIACANNCMGCTGYCEGCLGPAAVLPWCWPCVVCAGCAIECLPHLHCVGHDEHSCAISGNPTVTMPDGSLRAYIMGNTTCTSPPCPLIINIHSFLHSAASTSSSNYIGGEIDRDVPLVHPGGAMVVYPDALGVPGVAGSCWNVPGGSQLMLCNSLADDVAYISAIIDEVTRLYPDVDPDRVYAFGHSNGGAMTMTLACYLSDKVAAFAMVGQAPLQAELRASPAGARCRTRRATAVNDWTCPWGARRADPDAVDHHVQDNAAWYKNAEVSATWFASQLDYFSHSTPCDGWGSGTACEASEWVGLRSPLAATNAPAPKVRIEKVYAPGAGGMPTGHSYDLNVNPPFPTTARLLPFLFSYRKSNLIAPSLGQCRSDICGDNGNDCCAPGGEARSCTLPGYEVSPGGSSHSHCFTHFGASAIYQCCPVAVKVAQIPMLSHANAADNCAQWGLGTLCSKEQLCPAISGAPAPFNGVGVADHNFYGFMVSPPPSPTMPPIVCDFSKCEEHYRGSADGDCCGWSSDTYCGGGYTHAKVNAMTQSITWLHKPASWTPSCPLDPPYHGNTCCSPSPPPTVP